MIEKLSDKVISILIAYIGISWILAFLVFCYEFLIGPMFITLSPQINLLLLNLNLSENQIVTQVNQLLPMPLNQFIGAELILLVPSTVLFGLIYHEAIKENDDE